jgi:hypothetical protein
MLTPPDLETPLYHQKPETPQIDFQQAQQTVAGRHNPKQLLHGSRQ